MDGYIKTKQRLVKARIQNYNPLIFRVDRCDIVYFKVGDTITFTNSDLNHKTERIISYIENCDVYC